MRVPPPPTLCASTGLSKHHMVVQLYLYNRVFFQAVSSKSRGKEGLQLSAYGLGYTMLRIESVSIGVHFFDHCSFHSYGLQDANNCILKYIEYMMLIIQDVCFHYAKTCPTIPYPTRTEYGGN